MNVFLIIFADIDGTILDYTTYSYTKSLPAIQKLASRDIPLILVSSKTYSEILKLHKKLSLKWPFIFENGAGIANPDGTYSLYGKPYHELVKCKPIIEQTCGNVQWADNLSLQELSHYTGLCTEDVKDMMTRMASILFIPQHLPDVSTVNKHLQKYGIAITTGGRFFTVIDSRVSKGTAIQTVVSQYRVQHTGVYSYAIGDGLNDVDMFTAVDTAYFVGKNKLWEAIHKICLNLHRSRKTGPEGFSEVIESIIKNYSLT